MVLDTLKKRKEVYFEDLVSLAKIPSISFPGFPREAVEQSAEKVKELIELRGFQKYSNHFA